MNKLPISALVASYNEGHLLEECLKSLQFCDEVVLVDLNSKDNTALLARQWATTYHFEPEYVPYFDVHHHKYIPPLKHDWIILIDPDERIPYELALSIKEKIESLPAEISAIRIPRFNYFKNRRLKGTIYGGVVYARLLYKKEGITIDDDVHAGIKVKTPDYDIVKIRYNGKNAEIHMWCDSWTQLLDKHKRYLSGEGKSRYNRGFRYKKHDEWKELFRSLYMNVRVMKAYKDGLTGFGITLLEARYAFLATRRLKEYQREQLNR